MSRGAEWHDQDEEERERAERIHEVKHILAGALAFETEDVESEPTRLEDDLWVEGPLSQIMEFCQSWRSEIEELGEN